MRLVFSFEWTPRGERDCGELPHGGLFLLLLLQLQTGFVLPVKISLSRVLILVIKRLEHHMSIGHTSHDAS